MQEHYDRLGIEPGATPADVKSAYHAKLKAFPAHSHPQEFKAVRAAYEAIRKAPKAVGADFFELKPIGADLDDALLSELRQKATEQLSVSLNDLILLTF